MRNILALVAAAAVVVVGLGWYLGWYHVQSTPSSDGHQHISIDVDKKKIAEDVKHGVKEGTQKVEGFLQKEGVTVPTGGSTPPRVQVSPGHPVSGVQGTFRYNSDGTIEYTGEVSTPVPITK